MTNLSLTLFGSFVAEVAKRPLDQFRTTKIQALLIYLAVEAPTIHQRETLMELLWPGLPRRSAQVNLRQIVYQLGKAIPDINLADNGETAVSFLISDRKTVQLDPDYPLTTDVATFSNLLHRSQIHNHSDLLTCPDCQSLLAQAAELYNGDFLADFSLYDSNNYEAWSQAKREGLRRRLLDALDTLSHIYITRADYVQAESTARRQLAIDSYRESATRQLMHVLALNGRRSEALTAYKNCEHLLATELGMSPTVKTTALYEQIRSGDLSLAKPQTKGIRGYDLKEELGTGTFGTVHRALQKGVGREVAVKIIKPHYANQPQFIRRFEAEAQIVARLEHPYIVPLYDYWREPDGAYLVMRWLRGGNLGKALAERPYDPQTAVTLVDQIADALYTSHRQGIVHRDVKPANILLDEAGNSYLSDFGIARELDRSPRLTATNELVGSPAYIAPEQLKGEEVTPATDIYSLGLVMYELLTGSQPFPATSIVELIQKQVNESLPLVHRQRPELPAAVDDVIQQATAKRASDRFSDTLALAAAFRTALQKDTPTSALAVMISITDEEIVNPYQGLRPFQEIDAARFFGRTALVNQLLNRLSPSQQAGEGWGGGQHRFLAVVGPSGSGKSSVVKAGLIPALREGALPGSENWFVAEMMPGSHPLEELEVALMGVAVNPPPSLLEPLQKDERGLTRVLKRVLPHDMGQENVSQLLLVVDQFEELFTLVPHEADRVHFINNLLTALNETNSRLWLVLTLRADFYDRPLHYPELGELMKQQTEIVLPLTPAELEQAVASPAAGVGVTYEPGLITAITTDVNEQPGALPLVQYALTEMFEGRNGRTLTLAAYQAIGGISGALVLRADEIYDHLDAAGQAAARQLFLRLITLGEGVEDTRRRVRLSELESLSVIRKPDSVNRDPDPENQPTSHGLRIVGHGSRITDHLFNEFSRHRLLTFDRDPITREPTVEVAHEALLREWGRLRGWLDESRADVRLQRLLAGEAAEWRAAGEDPGFLLRGSRLNQFEGWVEQTDVALTQDERAFLAASLTARQQRREAEEARRQRELETAHQLVETERQRAEEQTRSAHRLRRRALYLAGVMLIAVILAVTAVANAELAATRAAEALANAAIAATRQAEALAEANLRATAEAIAIQERETAEHQARLATSRELALAALNTLTTDPELSILLALHAIETAYTQAAEGALHQAVQQSRLRQAIPGVWGAAYHPDGAYVATIKPLTAATTNETDLLQVWDLAINQAVFTVTLPAVYNVVAYSPDGRTIATGHEDGTVILWDAATGEQQGILRGHTAWVNWVVFSPDGRRLASNGGEGVAVLWDLESSEPLFTFPGTVRWDIQVVFSPDGTLLAVPELGENLPTAATTTNFWDTTSGTLRFTWMGQGLEALSPDGAYAMLNNIDDQGVTIRDLATSLATGAGQPFTTLAGHTAIVESGAFSPDGAYVATGSHDGTAKVWDARTGQEQFTLAGHTGTVVGVAFSPDGRRLLTVGGDGARIWDVSLPGNDEVMALAGPDDNGDVSMALSPNGAYLALGGIGGDTHLHDAASGDLLAILAGHSNGIFRLAFSPDGRRLASAGQDGLVKVWDVAGSLVAGQGQSLLSLEAHDASAVLGGRFTGVQEVAYSPDGTRLATGGADGMVRLWDAASGDLLAGVMVRSDGAGVWSVAFSPDGQYLAAGGETPDAIVKVWQLAGNSLVEQYTLTNLPGRILNVRFSPDGTLLLTSGTEGHLALWDALTDEPVRSFSGHVGAVSHAAFSQDGRTLASAGTDATIRLWDVASGNNLLTLATEISPWDVAFSPDGAYLYASNRAGELRVYAWQLETLVALARARLTRWWRPEECQLYLHMDSCPEK